MLEKAKDTEKLVTIPNAEPIQIAHIQAYALSVKPPVGPVSSLGNMPVRNAVLVAITSKQGVTGWGEVWCNFPPRGNLARLNLLQDVIAPYLIGKTYHDFSDCRKDLEKQFERMIIHTGEHGPYRHCIAGIDTALADLAARSEGLSLARFLSSRSALKVNTYASTPNVNDLERSIQNIIDEGFHRVKLKIGLSRAQDLKLVSDVADMSANRLDISLDANQNWNMEQAIDTLSALSDYNIGFIEEPLRADAPIDEWSKLSQATNISLAGGENIISFKGFREFIDQGGLKVVQPDVAKWGGVSGALEVGKLASLRGITCAFHYMGSAIGLAASIHTLAASGGDGPIELDANPNPLRTELGEIDLGVKDNMLSVSQGPGHGFVPDANALSQMTVASFALT